MNKLPEFDETMLAEQQGLFQKFTVTRTDGKDAPGQKHDGCEYFVLDVTHDIYAKEALTAYAAACATSHPFLSSDMVRRYALQLSKINQEPIGYFKGDQHGNLIWDEGCVCQDPVYSHDFGDGSIGMSIPIYTAPPNYEAIQKENASLNQACANAIADAEALRKENEQLKALLQNNGMNEFIKNNLMPGEVYAGLVLGKEGEKDYHLFLRPEKPEKTLSWYDATEWAKSIGYELPSRREQSMLFVNCQSKFEKAWYWSCEQHAHYDDYAWLQYFDYCDQGVNHKSDTYRARAVRRLSI